MTLGSIGRFHFFEQARALGAAGHLGRFYCDDPRVIPAAGWNRGRWLMQAGLLARFWPARATARIHWRGEQLARAIGAAELVKINSAFALETIRRGETKRVWVDHGSLDERHVAARMAEEAELWRDPLVAAGGNHSSRELVDRQAEEFAGAAGVVVASDLAARSAVAQGVRSDRVRVVPLGVDASRFAPVRPPASPGNVFRVLHAGPVNFNKGVHRLIDAFRQARLPGAELLLVGLFPNSAVRDRLVRQADGLAVEFRPPVPQSRLPELFADCQLFVLASLADGFGLTVLQAMACALPAVVTDACGCHELLHTCPGVCLVPAGDTPALTEALTAAYQARANQVELGRAARGRALELDWHTHAGRLVQALGENLHSEPAPWTPQGVPS